MNKEQSAETHQCPARREPYRSLFYLVDFRLDFMPEELDLLLHERSKVGKKVTDQTSD